MSILELKGFKQLLELFTVFGLLYMSLPIVIIVNVCVEFVIVGTILKSLVELCRVL
jgi:hypothetical protein